MCMRGVWIRSYNRKYCICLYYYIIYYIIYNYIHIYIPQHLLVPSSTLSPGNFPYQCQCILQQSEHWVYKYIAHSYDVCCCMCSYANLMKMLFSKTACIILFLTTVYSRLSWLTVSSWEEAPMLSLHVLGRRVDCRKPSNPSIILVCHHCPTVCLLYELASSSTL